MQMKTWCSSYVGKLLAVSLAVRIIVSFALLGSMPLVSDSLDYSDQAILLLKGFPGPSAYYWPPGTSYALSLAYLLFGINIIAAKALVIAASVSCVLLAYLIGVELLGNTKAAERVGWLASFYPPALMLIGQTYSQHLASLCLLGMAYFGLRGVLRRSYLAILLSGAFWAYGCLTRPSMLFVLPAAAIALVIIHVRRVQTITGTRCSPTIGMIVFLGIAAGILVPVFWHNYSLGAGATISTNNEKNFFYGNNPYTPHYKTGHFGQRSREELPSEVRTYLWTFEKGSDARAAMLAEAIRYIKEHPMISFYRTLNRIRAFWGFDYLASRIIQKWKNLGVKAAMALLFLEAGGYFLTMLIILYGLTGVGSKTPEESRWQIWLIALVIGYQFPYILSFSQGTYHFPAIWLLMPFAGKPICQIFSRSGLVQVYHQLRNDPWAAAALLVFSVIQIEYGYHMIMFA